MKHEFKITNNTDSVDIEAKSLGLSVRTENEELNNNRGLKIQIRHNRNKETFAAAIDLQNLIAAAPEMFNEIEIMRMALLNPHDESLRTACLTSSSSVIAKARGES